MGYWGIAMSLLPNPLTWPPDATGFPGRMGHRRKGESRRGQDPTASGIISRRLRLFYKDADKVTTAPASLAYEKAMEQVYLRYPEDHEAAVFYALALDATALPTDKTYANQTQGRRDSREDISSSSRTIPVWRTT